MKFTVPEILFAAVLMFPFDLRAEVADSLVYRHEQLENIEIVSNRIQSGKLMSPQQIIVCSADMINMMNRQNTGDLLQETGMVAVQKSQQGGGSPVIRGFEASRVLLVVDGIRMNNLIYRSGHLQNSMTVDQFNLENIEILNGPSSLNYGSDALGGTILFNTKSPKLAYDRRYVSGNAVFRYGSVNNEGTAHVDLNYGTGKFASLTSVSYSHFGDLKAGQNRNPFIPDGDNYIRRDWYVMPDRDGTDVFLENDDYYKQVGSGYEQYDIMQKFLFVPSRNHRHLFNFQLSNTGNINRYDRLTEFSVKDETIKPKYSEWYYGPQFRLLASYNFETREMLGADRTVLTLAYQKVKESRHNRKYKDELLNNRWENVNMFTLNADWIKYIGSHKVDAGIDGVLSYLESTANLENVKTGEILQNTTRYPDGNNHMHSVEAFAMHTWNISEKLRFQDGIRLGYSSVYSSTDDVNVFPFFGGNSMVRNNMTYSLALGINYIPVRTWKMSASLSSAYRVPNIDNASKVFDSKSGTVTVPNSGLKPEKTISFDVNITKHIDDRLTWENVFFSTYYFDAITTARGKLNGMDKIVYDGVVCDVYTSVNSRKAFLCGYSGSVTANPVREVELYGTFNYTYGRILDTDKPLDHIPPVFGRVGAAYVSPDGKYRADVYAMYNGKKKRSSYNLEGEDNIVYATQKGEEGEGSPAWYTLNVRFSCNINSIVTLQAGVENILDTEYRTFASGINAPGRNIYMTARLGF